MTTKDVVSEIRSASTEEEAIAILKKYLTPPRSKNKPPTFEEVCDFARERAFKDDDDASYYTQQAEKAFDFYESNMKLLGCTTWKDGNGNPVKNWKLKLANNWFK